MEPEVIGVPPSVYQTALRVLFDLEPLHLAIFVFGVSIVLLLSVLLIWKQVKEGTP